MQIVHRNSCFHTTLRTIAVLAMVSVLWSGSGLQWWMAVLHGNYEMMSWCVTEETDNHEDHHEHKDYDLKILLEVVKTGREAECQIRIKPIVDLFLLSSCEGEVLTPPPECA